MLRPKTFVWLVAMLVASLACSMSGSSAPASNNPLDSNSLATIVVGTANAAAAQTAQVDLLTVVPTATSTEAISPATRTPLPPNMSSEGTSLIKQDDGSYIFNDYKGGYSMVVSSEWLAVRPNQQEFMKAWTLPSASDQRVQDFLNKLQKEDPKLFRLAAADITPAHMQENLISTFTVSWDRTSTLTLAQEVVEAGKEIKTLDGLKVTNTDTGTSSTRIPMAIIETSVTNTMSFNGVLINTYQKIVIFKVTAGTVTLTLTTTPALKDTTISDFDAMTDQIRMLP